MPKLKLTPSQWRALTKRLVEKEGSITTPNALNEIMKFEPPVEKTYGRMVDYEQPFTKGFKNEDIYRQALLPIEEAREAFEAQPQRYKPLGKSPSADVARVVKGEVGPETIEPNELVNPENFAERVAYEKMKFESPMPKGMSRLLSEVIPSGPVEEVPRVAQESIVPQVKEADAIWKELGGLKSIAGQLWNRIFSTSHGRARTGDPRSYFVQMYIKWKENPNQLASKQKREKMFLDSLQEELEESKSVILGTERFNKRVQGKGISSQKKYGYIPGSILAGGIVGEEYGSK